ncbi:universal stress protein [Actinoplanes sp. NPDC051851]|uniref:universal stress protein n=1 Tax=Actinoplanes sp. NPDC051851 TaxID=3154753 RepID=UPI00342D3A4C
MSNLDHFTAEKTARRGTRTPTQFGEAINRYLGATGYTDPYAPAPMLVPATGTRRVAPNGGIVLVGVDDSPISCSALDQAAIEAELHGWSLRIVTVRRSGTDESGERLLERLTDRVHAIVPTVPVTSRLAAASSRVPALLDLANEADLLVVGHRHGAATTALGGSVADQVARRHAGPVMVVRMPGWPAGPDFGSRPLLAAVDGSPPAHAAMEYALAEAAVRGCDVTLLHVVGSRMDVARRVEHRDGVTVHHRILSGDPVEALIEQSARAAAVVVGRSRHDLLARTLLSPAAHLLPQRSFCPVFVV